MPGAKAPLPPQRWYRGDDGNTHKWAPIHKSQGLETNPTCYPSCGLHTAEQDPAGTGRCWQHYWAPNPPPAASQLEWLQLEEAGGPQPKPNPLGTQLPPALSAVPQGTQPISHSNNLHSATLAKPCACCAPVMCQSCAHHVPARMGAELLHLLCCTGQLMQQNRSKG